MSHPCQFGLNALVCNSYSQVGTSAVVMQYTEVNMFMNWLETSFYNSDNANQSSC